MDAKANTHICAAPVSQESSETVIAPANSAYLIVLAGGIPGTMVRVNDRGTTLGRSADSSFQISDLTVSRQHAFLSVDEVGTVHLRDEGSTNGTFVNGKRVAAYRSVSLDDGDRIQLGTTVILKLARLDPTDELFQREMFERTVRDNLTGLYNRAYLLNRDRTVGGSGVRPRVWGLAVLMLDIDHFKQINDRHGHLVGDGVLREVAAVIRESTRAEDLVARFGGEEFVVALPISVAHLAADRAERIRTNLAERRIRTEGQEIQVTASIGLAFGPPGRSRNEMALIMTADEALYQAKAEGRNRVVLGHHAMQLVTQTDRIGRIRRASLTK